MGTILFIRLQYRLRQQGAVADAGWNKDDITLLEFIALCVYQVFDIAIIPTAKQFVKSVAVKVNIAIGIGEITVCIHKGRIHLQLLVEITGVDSHLGQLIVKT